jgi:hypothetical protein
MKRYFAFWPFKPEVAILAVPVILAVLLTTWGVVEAIGNLNVNVGWLLVGIALVSASPLLLHVFDGMSRGGGSLEIASVRIALSAVADAVRSPTVPRNAGLEPGQKLNDSGNKAIEEMLKSSATSAVAVVDLEDGTAWWETRLLILAAGAARLGRPRAIVFTAVLAGAPNMYVGWAAPGGVRDGLLAARAELRQKYARAATVASRWRQVEPPTPLGAQTAPPVPDYQWVVQSQGVEFPSLLLEEQVLAAPLSGVEATSTPASVDVAEARRVFAPFLHTHAIEEAIDDRAWIRSALTSEDEYVAVTNRGRYVASMGRGAVTNAVLSALSAQWLSEGP